MDLERLTRPEYLSDQELKKVLLSHHVAVPDDMARCHVLDLFKKVARPLPQRERPTHDESSRFSQTENNKSEQTMDIDDVDIDAKLAPSSINVLRNQFNDIVRISDRKVNSSRKRQPSSQLPFQNHKNRKLIE